MGCPGEGDLKKVHFGSIGVKAGTSASARKEGKGQMEWEGMERNGGMGWEMERK